MTRARPLPGGVYAALITPLDEVGGVDELAANRLVDELLDTGVTGLCPVGSAGEGPLLGPDRRADVVRLVCQHAAGRVPVIPTVCHSDVPSAAIELQRFARLGATAALVTAPPFYAFGPAELTNFFESIADSAPLPVLLYDVPGFAGVQIGSAVTVQLARHRNIIGIKDSTGDEANLRALLSETAQEEFAVYCGSEPLIDVAATNGAAGVIGGSVNVAPRLVNALWQAASAAKPEAAELQAQLTELTLACRNVGRPFGWKAGAAELGRCRLQYCAPVPTPSADAMAKLREIVTQLNISASAN